jgi:hypothetical protein
MGALPVKYVQNEEGVVHTIKESKNIITKWINDKFNLQRSNCNLRVPPPTKIKGNQEAAIYHVLNNNNIPTKDLLEKDHVALLHPNIFFDNMRQQIIRDDMLHFY